MDMIVTDVMQTLDDDGNGSLDIDEFVRGSLKTPFLCEMLEQQHHMHQPQFFKN
jgi:hypothetical protein